jgi:hypothetical protein
MEHKLRSIGIVLNKNNWPYVTREQLIQAGISHAEFQQFFKPATLHESQIGNISMRKKGIVLVVGSSTRVMKLV